MLKKESYGVDLNSFRGDLKLSTWIYYERYCEMKKTFKLFLLVLFFLPFQVHASLSQDDYNRLTVNLQILSDGWNQPAVDESNQILCNTNYDRYDWNEYFSEYFSTNPFTYDLWYYLHHPVFSWCTDEAQVNLQEGMTQPLLDSIETIMSTHTPNLGQALFADEDLRDSLFRAHGFMTALTDVSWGNLGDVSDETRNTIYNFYIAQVETYPAYLKKSSTIDIIKDPFVGALRIQVHMNLRNFLDYDQSLKNEITIALDIKGTYLQLWDNFSVLIFDNNGLDEEQLSKIYDLLSKVPNGLHIMGGISQYDLLGNTGVTYVPLPLMAPSYVNISDVPVGAQSQNGFPNEVPPKYSDLFSLVLIHELNHMVDAYTINNDPQLSNRKADIINSAGCEPMNYLRSMFDDCLFVNAPQEFFASLSNQWFSSSERTLELAFVRFDNGYTDPINQFLFFAEVYSQGGSNTYFFKVDTSGNITKKAIPMAKDANGNIISLTTPKGEYIFTYDENGNVIGYNLKPPFPWPLFLPAIIGKIRGLECNHLQTPPNIPSANL